MISKTKAVDEDEILSPDRVREAVIAMIRTAQAGGWTLERLAATSGVKLTTIKGWLEGKEPTFSKVMSVALVLGRRAVNQLIALIGYGAAAPLDELHEDCPLESAVAAAHGLAIFLDFASDRRIDHTERPKAREAVDMVIAELTPWSSAGGAV